MTKEITKAFILQELQDKFKLREFAPASFLFDETVVPVYNIGPHLTKWGSYRKSLSITTTGGVEVVKIPSTERWRLRAYAIVFASGVFTIAGVYVFRNLRSAADNFSYLDLTAAQNTSYLRTLPEAVTLEPNDAIMVNVDGYTSTGSIHLHLDYMREEIR